MSDDMLRMNESDDVADALARLHRSGWSIGDVGIATESGTVWLVTGRNGENLIRAEGATQREAWQRAIEQAREVGMLAS